MLASLRDGIGTVGAQLPFEVHEAFMFLQQMGRTIFFRKA
jgi:hypothetical protein